MIPNYRSPGGEGRIFWCLSLVNWFLIFTTLRTVAFISRRERGDGGVGRGVFLREILKTIVFWTFSKLFCSCLGSLRALFTTLKDQFLSVFLAYYKLFATHTCSSPLRSREALINVDKASPGLLIFTHTENVLFPKGEVP